MTNSTFIRGSYFYVGILFLVGGCGDLSFLRTGPCCDNPPTINGCGAADAIVWTSESLDCLNVSLFCKKTVCFMPACDMHDKCYGTAFSNKIFCDFEYFFELNRICQASDLSIDEFIICTGHAAIYAAAVGLIGGEAYIKGQTEACYCEDPVDDQ